MVRGDGNSQADRRGRRDAGPVGRAVWFGRDESGAVTADYVGLAAAVLGVGVAVIANVSRGTEDLSARAMETAATQSTASAGAGGGSNVSGTGGSGGSSGGGGSGGNLPPFPGDDSGSGGSGSGAGAGGSGSGGGGDEAASGNGSDSGGGDSGGGDGGSGGDGGDGGAGGEDGGAGDGDADGSGGAGGTPSGGGSGGSSGGGGQGAGESGTIEADFHIGTVTITPGWGDRVDSGWIPPGNLPVPMPATFDMLGEGNPRAQSSNGQKLTSGEVSWGTIIDMDTPPCGTTRTVYISLNGGQSVGSFSVIRPEWPAGWGAPPAGC